MSDLVAGGHVVDVILALTLLEAVALAAYHRCTGRGVAPAGLLGNLLAGAALLMALRGALTGAWWGWIAFWLAAALLAHLADLRSRWRA